MDLVLGQRVTRTIQTRPPPNQVVVSVEKTAVNQEATKLESVLLGVVTERAALLKEMEEPTGIGMEALDAPSVVVVPGAALEEPAAVEPDLVALFLMMVEL
jgi:hypothetical protein